MIENDVRLWYQYLNVMIPLDNRKFRGGLRKPDVLRACAGVAFCLALAACGGSGSGGSGGGGGASTNPPPATETLLRATCRR